MRAVQTTTGDIDENDGMTLLNKLKNKYYISLTKPTDWHQCSHLEWNSTELYIQPSIGEINFTYNQLFSITYTNKSISLTFGRASLSAVPSTLILFY